MNLDLTQIPRRYSGKWVAISIKTNTVITSGINPKKVLKKSKGKKDIVITLIPVKNYSYLL